MGGEVFEVEVGAAAVAILGAQRFGDAIGGEGEVFDGGGEEGQFAEEFFGFFAMVGQQEQIAVGDLVGIFGAGLPGVQASLIDGVIDFYRGEDGGGRGIGRGGGVGGIGGGLLSYARIWRRFRVVSSARLARACSM